MSAAGKKQVHIPFVGKAVEDLVLWKDPKHSAVIFGGATAAFLAYALNPFPAVTIVCYVVAIAALSCFLWSQMSNFVSRSGPPVPAFLVRGLTEEEASKVAVAALPALNKALALVGVLASGKDLKLSLAVVFGGYGAARVFALISPVALAYLVVLVAFTAPKAYELKQGEVDRAVAAVRARLDEAIAKFREVVSKIPKASVPKKGQ